jgi:uncharacterized protein involved in outer membrane biogenesis
LFSTARLISPAVRRVDGSGTYYAHRLLLSQVEVTALSAPFSIEHGLIKAPTVTGRLMGGDLELRLDTDANQAPARSRIDLTLRGVRLAQMPHSSEPPPFDGVLRLHLHAQGRGDSLHALAASAEGRLTSRVLEGTMRASLAELTGIDWRGLGLTLTRSSRAVTVPCAAADFDIHSGVMQATRLFIDSEPVFISGTGRVLLDAETLELKLQGAPKRLRMLRIQAPILVQGALLKPKFDVGLAESRLRLLDFGTPHSVDCAELPVR